MKQKASIIRRFLLLFILALPLMCYAQERIQKGKTEAKYNVIPNGYNFWMYTPADYESGVNKYPLIIFLHGASLSGYDLNKVKRYGVIDAISKGKIIPALVAAPQTHNGWNPDKVNDLLEWVEENYRVDKSRIYVIGMSMGGYGTMDFCNKYPEKVAAGMAFCGGCSSKDCSGLSKLPFWIMHGTADRAVSISCSQRVVKYLQDNCDTHLLRYDWMPGGSHGVYARMFYLQKTYDWLFSHSTNQHPRKVDMTFDINRDDLKQTYNELKWFKGMFEDD